ncbi:three-prime repair exonuclease 1 [Octopus bimaculoides]|uniref:Exonuclease domain-containing protein n=1 Tax=Octopus bimaculoides TaxID=37653 RepID=A0A0L8G521_OCTBM|nr:three-prime repair exonuclease 1 [Octopus bimaculoides]|eukprot:XP_014784354.1 PREDICTED: three-prime repair exonuclease 1-like [Octopus bimaculoides]
MATPSSSTSSETTSPSSSSFSFRKINTFVFFDLETTGLNEIGNRPKITELAMIAVSRNELSYTRPRVLNNLRLCFYPNKLITPAASKLTRLFNDALQDQSIFDINATQLLDCFLTRLKKPVCLVAHGGNDFDFGLLQAELRYVQATLMLDLLCVDTLKAVKDLDTIKPSIMTTPTKNSKMIPITPRKEPKRNYNDPSQTPNNSQIQGVDKAKTWLWKGMGNSVFLTPKSSPEKVDNSDKYNSDESFDDNEPLCKKGKISYKLGDIYRREIGSEPINAHSAESDSMMLMTIIIKRKDEFLPWMDKYSAPFSFIRPLYEYNQR